MADSSCGSSSHSVDLFHPEIMSTSQLYCLLQKGNINIEDSDKDDRNKLLEIFYKTLLPLPQRDYRQNRRGQLMMEKRKKCLEKKKIEAPSLVGEKSVEPPKKSLKVVGSISKSPEVSAKSKERLSPIIFDKKVVQLSPKPCNGSDSAVKNCESNVSKSKSKMIKLINETLMSNAKSHTVSHVKEKKSPSKHKLDNEISSTNEAASGKKKHKPITWP